MTTSPVPAVGFPMQLDLDAPDKVARWRPLVHWLLAIPQVIVLYALGIVQSIVWVFAFFAILFTGAMPESLFGFMAMTHRYQWRLASYIWFMRESYPPFEFVTVGQDPGDDPARLSIEQAPKLSRGLIFVKWLLAIPHYFVLLFPLHRRVRGPHCRLLRRPDHGEVARGPARLRHRGDALGLPCQHLHLSDDGRVPALQPRLEPSQP